MVSCKMKCDKSFKLYRISFFMCSEFITCNTFFILGGVNLRMITFRHLSYEDREKIEKLMNDGKKVVDIAAAVGVHRATIYNELKRGGMPYKADIAQKKI